jgi:hypothetical protein
VPGWVTTHAPPSRQGDAGAAVRRSRRRWRGGCHPPGDAEAQAIQPRTTPDSEVSERVPADAIASWVVISPGSVPGAKPSAGLTASSAARRKSLSSRALQKQHRRAADDVAEHALGRGSVLVGMHPAPLLMLGDQPAGQAIPRLLPVLHSVRPTAELGDARLTCERRSGPIQSAVARLTAESHGTR